MIPDPAEIVRRRWTLTTAFRVGGLGLTLLAARPAFSWLVEGMQDGDLWDLGYYADRVASVAACVVGGLAVFFLSRPLSRWTVPVRHHTECPSCRHRIEGLVEPRCTECGLLLTPEFTTGRRERPESSAARAVHVLRRRETVASIFRLVGIFSAVVLVLWGSVVLISALYLFLSDGFSDYEEFVRFVLLIVFTFVWLLVTFLFLRGARVLARFCVPFEKGRDLAGSARAPADRA